MSFVRNLRQCVGKLRHHSKISQIKRFQCTTSSMSQKSLQDDSQSPAFPGFADVQYVSRPTIVLPEEFQKIPIYRVMNRDGVIEDSSQDPNLSQEMVTKMFRDMVLLDTMDKILYESQRQGRISFYMTNFGEEAVQIGGAAALDNEDMIYGQYREAGVLVWRGFTISEFVNQCFGNSEDEGKGKQMPVHYGSKRLNFVTISSPLGTQTPQAAGAAYALKLKKDNKRCVVTYFGEGASSEGDVHAAFNFSATLGCPLILFCRNNGYAISTPAHEQYKGDGIASRGHGYGIAAMRVDGTDIFAVYNAMKKAKEYVVKNNKPIIFETLACRIGHHSTSDDSSAYRNIGDLEVWNTTEHPITKLKNYMKAREWWNEEEEKNFVKSVRKQILSQVNQSEKILKPDWREMFNDVYHEMPKHLKEQMDELEQHIKEHPSHYPLKSFKG
ncbi:2-oxoisovalerate dehydrogenase subunit alpha, mitochondrial [Culicoides brevitarsis]|uniref:2-oxoisovalerate dehydrogenase subunit alpha, mitochondrial n=1 Tax=Culicoides brevitarsis TaxID=469753 RepID=UPI00307C61D2